MVQDLLGSLCICFLTGYAASLPWARSCPWPCLLLGQVSMWAPPALLPETHNRYLFALPARPDQPTPVRFHLAAIVRNHP
jgi:hypothetical protein